MRIVKTKSFGKVVVMSLVAAVTILGAGFSAESSAHMRHAAAESDGHVSSSENAGLVPVAAKFVCMPNNKRFKKEQIPIEIDDKTYYGCCKMCVNMLKLDPKVRTAVDPVSGKQVDKSVAVIGAAANDKVYYFENEQNLRQFKPKSNDGE